LFFLSYVSWLNQTAPESSFQIIANDINPFVDAWEEEKKFPAHTVFKALGNAGFLGVNKPSGKNF